MPSEPVLGDGECVCVSRGTGREALVTRPFQLPQGIAMSLCPGREGRPLLSAESEHFLQREVSDAAFGLR